MKLSKVIFLALVIVGSYGGGIAIGMPGDQLLLAAISGLLIGAGAIGILQPEDGNSYSDRW